MTDEQKALEVLAVIARMAADGQPLTIAEDWGFGTATIICDGSHTHVGYESDDDCMESLTAFVYGLHNLLVNGRGLSWAKDSNVELRGAPPTGVTKAKEVEK